MNGYIKLHRQLIEWEWYGDIKVFRVFLHLLLIANFKDSNWRGTLIKRGQVIIGKESLGKTLGLSVQEIKTVLKKLKKSGEISTKATPKFIIVTISNFDSYQDKEPIIEEVATSKQPHSNPIATSKQPQRKNDKKERKKEYITIEQARNIIFDMFDGEENVSKNIAIQYKQQTGQTVNELTIQIAVASFLQKGIPEYYQNLTRSDQVIGKLMGWITNNRRNESHYTHTAKSDSSAEQKPLNLEAYILENHRPVDLKYMKKDGRFERWNKELQENSFRLANISKAYKNKNISTMLLFEISYMPLGNQLSGSTAQRKLDSFVKYFNKLSDYNQNCGNIRSLLKEHNKRMS